MAFVFSLFLFLVLLGVNLINKDLPFRGISLCKTFIAFWAIIIFMRGFHFFGLYETSIYIYTMVIFGCLFFVAGYIGASVKIRQASSLTKFNPSLCKLSHLDFKPLFYVALAFAIFIAVKQIIAVLPILLASGFADARTEISVEELFLQGDWAILMNYFARPFIKASLVIMIVNMFRERISIRGVLLVLLLLVVAFASEGGRLLIMDVFFAFLYMIVVNKKQMRLKDKRTAYKAIVLIFLFTIYSTLERGSSVFENMYLYYCGGLTYFGDAIQSQSQIFEPSLYGLNCYQGLFKPLFGILEYIGIPKPDSFVLADKFILDAQATVIDITPNGSINYYITLFGYAYRDGGLLFVCIDLLIYGYICFWADKIEHKRWGDVRWTAVKILFFYTALFTMAVSPFATFMPMMTFVYIIIITTNLFCKRVIVTK